MFNPALAAAQDGPVSNAQSAPQQDDKARLDEIIVTAQRITENVQKAAVPIAVVSPDTLRKAGVVSPDNLTRLVPALTIASTGGSSMSLFLRGVGNFTLNSTFDSAIAFNYDNVYIPRTSATTGFFYDLERIEVLKGPQGTLYGRNATGGAINILPVKPKLSETSAFVNGSYGNYNSVTLEGALNLPTGDDGAVRISGNLSTRDGYLTDGTSDQDLKAVRFQIMQEIGPDLTVRLAADYSAIRGRGPGATYLESYQFNGAGYTETPSLLDPSIGLLDPRSQAYRRQFFVVPAGRFLNDLEAKQFINNDHYGVNAEINLRTGAGELTIIPSWRKSEQEANTSTLPFQNYNNTQDEHYSIEARFAGDRVGIFDYTLGGIYYHETQDELYVSNQQTLYAYTVYHLKTESLAAFARITANVTDTFRVVAGGRFTHDRKSSDNSFSDTVVIACTTLPTPCLNAPLFNLVPDASLLGISNLPPQGPGGIVPYIDGNGVPQPNVLIIRSPVTAINNSVKKDSFTWRAGVEFDAGPQSLLYATVETGFRVGGLQPVIGFESFQPEKITAYTIGSKNRFWGNRLQLNVEGFVWKYRDQQIAAVGVDGTGTTNFFVQNVGKSTSYGFEVDAQVAATRTTRIGANIQYLHAEYDRFKYDQAVAGPAAPFVGCPTTLGVNSGGNPVYSIDCSGKPSFNSPRWTFNANISQTIPLGSYQIVASADTQYRSSRWVGYDYISGMKQDSTWQSNAQLQFEPVDSSWFIAAYVRNIEDDRYKVNAVNSASSSLISVTTNAPRTYGVRAGVRF
ncbi:TonB-dependent receptor [Novosphingobium pentaromativorans]|nr:TonB-dependent receptor [Novosphingobium pentaromativorans]AIT81989.1 hypothetical protein JI59_20780 [Novosphingobium pentaromativorans US6-1]